jgi:hypothetical protein
VNSAIRFLEQAGRTPMSPAQYTANVSSLDLDKAQRCALLDRDSQKLNLLLGGRTQVLFAILAPDEEVPPDSYGLSSVHQPRG